MYVCIYIYNRVAVLGEREDAHEQQSGPGQDGLPRAQEPELIIINNNNNNDNDSVNINKEIRRILLLIISVCEYCR